MLGVGSILGDVLECACSGPVPKVRCLAVVDDAVDRRYVVEVELHVVLGLVAEV